LEARWAIIAEPQGQKYNPKSVVDAQFSMPFGAAVAVLRGARDSTNLPSTRFVRRVREMMQKVVLVRDARLEETFPREWPARVSIQLNNGQPYEEFIRYPKGDPENR